MRLGLRWFGEKIETLTGTVHHYPKFSPFFRIRAIYLQTFTLAGVSIFSVHSQCSWCSYWIMQPISFNSYSYQKRNEVRVIDQPLLETKWNEKRNGQPQAMETNSLCCKEKQNGNDPNRMHFVEHNHVLCVLQFWIYYSPFIALFLYFKS